MNDNSNIHHIYNYCPKCEHYDLNLGACSAIQENVRSYPNKFFKKCNGEFFVNDDRRYPQKIEEVQERAFAKVDAKISIDYDQFCCRCKFYDFNRAHGILCGLTKEKPSFEIECPDFVLDPVRDKNQTRRSFKQSFSNDEPLPDMRSELKKWGIGLILMGFISILLSDYLDPVWGALILILGILNLLIIHRVIFIFNGIALMLAGFLNIVGNVANSEGFYFWMFFGGLQLVWGEKEIRKFAKYNKRASQNQMATD